MLDFTIIITQNDLYNRFGGNVKISTHITENLEQSMIVNAISKYQRKKSKDESESHCLRIDEPIMHFGAKIQQLSGMIFAKTIK